MANELTTTTTAWQPPQAKAVNTTIKVIGGLVGVGIGAFLITKFVPTWVAAVDLLTKLTSSMTHLAVAGAVLVFVIWLLNQTFSPNGAINKLFGQAYSSLITKLTWSLLDIDPITPLLDMRREAQVRKHSFDEAFSSFDGTISKLRSTEDTFMKESRQAESEAKAAKAKADAGEARMQTVFQSRAYTAGECKKSAQRFADMRTRLEPVRATIVDLQQAAELMIANLDTDIRLKRAEWDAQKNMEGMDKAARGILLTNSKQELAQNAQQLIEMKYAEQMGRLENLSTSTQGLRDSIDLNQATYSVELLSQWQQESAVLIEGPRAPAIQDQSSTFRNLVR